MFADNWCIKGLGIPRDGWLVSGYTSCVVLKSTQRYLIWGVLLLVLNSHFYFIVYYFLFASSGLEIKCFSKEPNCIFKSYLKVLCIETGTLYCIVLYFIDCSARIQKLTFCSLQELEGAKEEFKGALGSWHPAISSPDLVKNYISYFGAIQPGCYGGWWVIL